MTDDSNTPPAPPPAPAPDPDPVVSLIGTPLPPEVMTADPDLTSDSVYGSNRSRGYYADVSDGRSKS